MRETISIPFGPDAAGGGLTLELDDERNGGVSTFAPGTDVYIKARTSAAIVVRGSTGGRVLIDQAGIHDEQTEELVFENESSSDLRYPPLSIVGARWLGRGLGNVSWSGQTARVVAAGYGILEVVYRAPFTRLRLADVAESGKTLVWAEDANGFRGTLIVDFGDEGATLKSVYMVERDYCTDLPIAGALVYIDDDFKGVTGADGRIFIGQYLSGTTHTHKATAIGYKDSDVDALANDTFTVP